MKKFPPYNSIASSILKNIAQTIKNDDLINKVEPLKKMFTDYFNDGSIKEPLSDFSISVDSLLDVPYSSIIIEFNESPFCGELEGWRGGYCQDLLLYM